MMHRAIDIIRKKRDGQALTPAEVSAFVEGATRGGWPDYQVAALLMAICCRGMNAEESAELTRAMAASGARLDWSDVPGPKVDKHSTGGVGDKTSLIVAPLAACAGVVVPMMSGRGLGHTGGTLDKLEAIPGFRHQLSRAELGTALRQVGCAMIGQSADIAPADRRLYALRDVTATVESIPLITASILSKKIAEGIDGLVLDVKCGRGAFMKTPDQAVSLARSLVEGGQANGLRTEALITAMDAPLGRAVGNALEVKEAIAVLSGRGGAISETRRQRDKETRRRGDKEKGRQGDKETRRRGDKEKGRQGDKETRRRGDKEKGRQGDKETRRRGDKEKGRQGDKETRRQGEAQVSLSPCLPFSLSPPLPLSLSALEELSTLLAARMLVVGGLAGSTDEAMKKVSTALCSGHGLEKFRAIVAQQGGDPRVIDDPGRLPTAPHQVLLRAGRPGFVAGIDAEKVGLAAMHLGAGRSQVDDVIDPAVGCVIIAPVGAQLGESDVLAEVHYRREERLGPALRLLQEAWTIGDEPPAPGPLVLQTCV